MRHVAFAAAPLVDCKRAGKALDTSITLNDVVLSLVAGGVREWLSHRHGPTAGIRAKVPVSLHRADIHQIPGPAALDVHLGPEILAQPGDVRVDLGVHGFGRVEAPQQVAQLGIGNHSPMGQEQRGEDGTLLGTVEWYW